MSHMRIFVNHNYQGKPVADALVQVVRGAGADAWPLARRQKVSMNRILSARKASRSIRLGFAMWTPGRRLPEACRCALMLA
jgi:hypothetical protein